MVSTLKPVVKPRPVFATCLSTARWMKPGLVKSAYFPAKEDASMPIRAFSSFHGASTLLSSSFADSFKGFCCS